jgi:alginate O-acetyltransferase complex protein AlgI
VNFVSAKFFVFFVVVFFIYWQLSRRNQNIFILLASCLFYAAWDWRFLSLIGVSIVSNFYCGNRIAVTEDPKQRKFWLWAAVVINLGMLFYFKYAGFFANSLVALVDQLGGQVDHITLNILLPVGISFYVFHSLSYSIDIYRGHLQKSDSIVDFAAFVTFFPQMVAGPIVRARELLFKPSISPTSGDAGTFPCRGSSATTCTSPSAATAVRGRARWPTSPSPMW